MFDKDMLNDLAKLKVNRKRKVQDIESQIIEEQQLQKIESDLFPTSDEDFEEIVYEDENYEDYDENEEYQQEEYDERPKTFLSDSENEKSAELKALLAQHEKKAGEKKGNLQNLAEFMTGFKGKNKEPEQELRQRYEKDDYEDEELPELPQNNQSVEYKDIDGNQVNSKYIGEDGNINVVYGEPGKNIINRKTVEEQRLDNKMDALAGLLTRFKSEEELEAEENDPNVIIMDKQVNINKNLKKIDTVIQIRDGLDIKINFVKKAFRTITLEIEKKAKLPDIELDITRADYLRALFMKKNIDDMDVARIFTLSLFLQNPEKFPTEDTYEQVVYLNSQVGAKCKSIDLKRMITYISSESEFTQTVDLVSNIIKNPSFNADGVPEVFSIKCREALKTLMSKYLKNDSLDHMSKLNVLSIKKDIQMKARNITSSISLLDSLNLKLKAIHHSLKEQLRKTEEQITETQNKIETSKIELETMKKELTLLIVLETARKSGGYNLDFTQNIPLEDITKQLKEYDLDAEEFLIKDVIHSTIKDDTLNNIIKS